MYVFYQKSCIDFAINATPLERYMPEERVGFKYRLWRIVESTPFEYFIMTLIVLNTILLMMKVRQYQNLRCTTTAKKMGDVDNFTYNQFLLGVKFSLLIKWKEA